MITLRYLLVGLLQGKALTWAQAASSPGCLKATSYAELDGSLKAVFDHADNPGDAAMHLLSRQ